MYVFARRVRCVFIMSVFYIVESVIDYCYAISSAHIFVDDLLLQHVVFIPTILCVRSFDCALAFLLLLFQLFQVQADKINHRSAAAVFCFFDALDCDACSFVSSTKQALYVIDLSTHVCQCSKLKN